MKESFPPKINEEKTEGENNFQEAKNGVEVPKGEEREYAKSKEEMWDMVGKLNDGDGFVSYDFTPEMMEKRMDLNGRAVDLIGKFQKTGYQKGDFEKAHQLYHEFSSFYEGVKSRGKKQVDERAYEASLQRRSEIENALKKPTSNEPEPSVRQSDTSVEEITKELEKFKAEGGLNLYYTSKEDLVSDLISSRHLAENPEQEKIMTKFFEARVSLHQEKLWYKDFRSHHPFFAPFMKVVNMLALSPEILSGAYNGRKLRQMAKEGKLTEQQVEKINTALQEIKNEEVEKPSLEKQGGGSKKQSENIAQEETSEMEKGGLESFSSSIGESDPKDPNRINEDQVLERKDKGVYAVFDGVGGQEQGDVASYVAKHALSKECDTMPENMSIQETQDFVQRVIKKISDNIFENNRLATERGKLSNMASTMTLAVVWNGNNGEKKLIVGNIGDSRAYLQKQGKLEQLTMDDNYLRKHAGDDTRARSLQLILNNINSEEEINLLEGVNEKDKFLLLESFRNRNIIMKCLGLENQNPEVTVHDFPAGSELLLATDGLTDNLTDKEIEQNFGKNLAVAALKRSNEGHGRAKQDDISFVTVKNSSR